MASPSRKPFISADKIPDYSDWMDLPEPRYVGEEGVDESTLTKFKPGVYYTRVDGKFYERGKEPKDA